MAECSGRVSGWAGILGRRQLGVSLGEHKGQQQAGLSLAGWRRHVAVSWVRASVGGHVLGGGVDRWVCPGKGR